MWTVVLLCLILGACFGNSQYVGDSCEPNQVLRDGICTLITECEDAIRELKKNRRHGFKRCSFEGDFEVVCCPRTTSRFGGTTSKCVTRLLWKHGPGKQQTSEFKQSLTNSKRIADTECQKISRIPALDLHIIGGEASSLGEFPHMVALGFDRNQGLGYQFDCGGSVLSKDYVLTAAHCVDTLDNIQPSIVRTGVVELGGNGFDEETDVGIAQVIMHPNYTRKEKYHDLALLRLNKSLSFSSSLNAVCLETSEDNPTLPLLITGWGQTSNTRDAKSTILLKASVNAVSSDKCGESYTNWRKLPQGITREQMCAGDPKGLRDTCQGDSGGPLQSVNDEGEYRLVGVTSFGRGCGSPVPGVYTRVANYTDWIVSVVWPQ